MFQGSEYATDCDYVRVSNMFMIQRKELVLEQAILIFEMELSL